MALTLQQKKALLNALPDPAFLFNRQGKYLAVYGGKDARYYHDGSNLVGSTISELIVAEKADWFLAQIAQALTTQELLIVEYELCNHDVVGLPHKGPEQPIWFEGRIQALDFLVEGDEAVLWVASNINQRHELELKLRELSETDSLTGLFNRHRLAFELDYHFDLFKRDGFQSAFMMIDLDGLKVINDTFGHPKGDEAIILASKVIEQQSRSTDLCFRLGGDEFLCILTNTHQNQAIELCHRLLAVATDALKQLDLPINATLSIGLSEFLVGDKTPHQALERADKALYQAKRNGKCQAVFVDEN